MVMQRSAGHCRGRPEATARQQARCGRANEERTQSKVFGQETCPSAPPQRLRSLSASSDPRRMSTPLIPDSRQDSAPRRATGHAHAALRRPMRPTRTRCTAFPTATHAPTLPLRPPIG